MKDDTCINTVIIEADYLDGLADFIGMARYAGTPFFEVEAVWTYGLFHKHHCAMIKGPHSILKMLVEIASKRKYVKCYYSAFVVGQWWDKNKNEWVKGNGFQKKFEIEGEK